MPEIHLPIKVVPFQRPRFDGRSGRVYNQSTYTNFKNYLQIHFRLNFGVRPHTDPVHLQIKFGYRRPKHPKCQKPQGKPDLDNLVKCVMDCGNGILWRDDSQIVKLQAEKFYDSEHSLYLSFETVGE